jgi:hypothetical protein
LFLHFSCVLKLHLLCAVYGYSIIKIRWWWLMAEPRLSWTSQDHPISSAVLIKGMCENGQNLTVVKLNYIYYMENIILINFFHLYLHMKKKYWFAYRLKHLNSRFLRVIDPVGGLSSNIYSKSNVSCTYTKYAVTNSFHFLKIKKKKKKKKFIGHILYARKIIVVWAKIRSEKNS